MDTKKPKNMNIEETRAEKDENNESFNGNSSGDNNTSATDTNNEGDSNKVFNIDENSIQMESDTGGGGGGEGGGNKMDLQNSATEESEKARKRKRKHTRRGSKKNKPRKPRQHKFKPYNTLTWDEKRKLVEIDSVRAMQRRRELMLQKGCPIAPYNTTQFLMEEHAVPENLEGQNHHNNTDNNNADDIRRSLENDADTSSSSVSDDEYFDKDFNEFYDTVHMDTLNSYSKEHLISYIYELERKIEDLEKSKRNPALVVGGEQTAVRIADDVPELKGEVAQRAI